MTMRRRAGFTYMAMPDGISSARAAASRVLVHHIDHLAEQPGMNKATRQEQRSHEIRVSLHPNQIVSWTGRA